jgi:hypothetical protein
MTRTFIRYAHSLASIIICLAFPSAAFAACANPAGVEGEIIYNKDYGVVQFCNDVNWVRVGGGIDTRIGTLTASKWCSFDGDKINCAETAPLTSYAETDPQVGTLTNTKWCTSDGTAVNCATNAPVLTEVDPKIGTLSNGKVCTTNGTTISCTTDGTTLGAGDNLGNHTATQNLSMGANQVVFSNATGDKVYYYANSYGTGIEASTLTNWSAVRHRWRVGGASVTTGTDTMDLISTGLTVNGTFTTSGGGATIGGSLTAQEISSDSSSATYDVWLQGSPIGTAVGDGRNLALVGRSSDDVLFLNWNGEYTGGVTIGSATTVSGGVTATSFSGSGASLTSLNGSNISSGTVAAARMGASPTAVKTLHGDNTWSTIGAGEIANDAVSMANINASGTASSSTYLRGDGTWNTPTASIPSDLTVHSLTATTTVNAATGYKYNGTAGVTGSINASCYAGGITFKGGIVTGTAGQVWCGGADIAEYYLTKGDVSRGDIVALSDSVASIEYKNLNPGPGEKKDEKLIVHIAKVEQASALQRNRIVGIVPTFPKLISEQKLLTNDTPQQPVTLAGHAPVRMTMEGGPIAIGDPITISEQVRGAGTKATTSGRIVGYALEPYDEAVAKKKKMIEVFIHLEDWVAPQDNFGEEMKKLRSDNENLTAAITDMRADIIRLKRREATHE